MNPSLIAIGVYVGVLIAIGVAGMLRSRNSEEDYYLAGRRQGFLTTAFTIMATMFSSAAVLGLPGQVYQDGFPFFFFALNLPLTACFVYLLGSRISRIGRARGYVTPGDLVADYYGGCAGVRLAVALCGFLFVLPYVVMQVKAGGHLAMTLFRDDFDVSDDALFDTGALVFTGITTAYVLLGGMRSVAWSDVLQGVLLLSGMIIACAATIAAMGGLSAYFEALTELPPEAQSVPGVSGAWTVPKLMIFAFFSGVASIVQPAQWMRFYAAKSANTLRRTALIFAIVLPVCLMASMMVGLGGRALYPPTVEESGAVTPHPDVGANDQIVPNLMREHVPELLGPIGALVVAFFMVAVVAAAMSTADSNLHALSAVLTRDVYDRFIRPKASERERAWVGRGLIVILSLFAYVLVRYGNRHPDFEPIKMIAQLMLVAIAFSLQLVPAALDVLFVNRGSGRGALCGILSGLVVVFLFTPLPALFSESAAHSLADLTLDLKRNVDAGFCGLFVNVVVFAVVSRFTTKPAPDVVKAFRKSGQS
ncbi:MAG: hypothetical protein CMJ83_15080 [Planctomycetes bacterium]|nr:hypothetical protein [Planctomycetota bacterium]